MRRHLRLPLLSLIFLLSQPAFSHTHSLQLVQGEGSTITERIKVPPKFKRIQGEPKSFAEFLRNYSLKTAESPVLLFNGHEKQNQEAHACVFALPIENYDLQRNAQSIVRLYAEYLYKSAQEEKISFHLTNGETCKWTEWLEKAESKRNLRTEVARDLKKWTKYEKAITKKDKNEYFRAYLKTVFANTNPLSLMEYESEPTDFSKLRIGDILFDLRKSSQVCLVVDICKNPETGEKAVLLAQGSSPASEFYVIKNPMRVNDPWYHDEDFLVPLETPEYVFPKESWRRLKYLD